MPQFDVIVIGAGMAGASVAFELASDARVLLIEREERPGYHATGRSAAAYILSYGHEKPQLYQLTAASRQFLETPPPTFFDGSLLRRRGMLWISEEQKLVELKAEFEELRPRFPAMQWIEPDFLRERVPALTREYGAGAIFEPDVFDIDVHALHDAYLRGFLRRGGVTKCEARVTGLKRTGNVWVACARDETFSAPIVVNAAGAWVDEVAALAAARPVGIRPMRRTAVLLDPPSDVSMESWPLIMDHGGAFYFKPDAGLVLASPADETLSPPCDAQPEELDVAYAAHFAEQALGLRVQRVKHAWAGLRSFVADRCPVIGFAPDSEGFFWMAGQGGHGIQIAPAAARLAAALVRREPVPEYLVRLGFDPGGVSPRRLVGHSEAPRCKAG